MSAQTVTRRAAAAHAPQVRPPRFTGRDAESRRITDALAAPSALVLVEGEAGVGKTRLVGEFFAQPSAAVGMVLLAVCPPFRQPLTLGPIVDALREAVGDVGGLGLSALTGALCPLFPEWVGQLPPEPPPVRDAGAARHRVFRALAELLTRLGVSVLVVEDAHWADDATLEFLLFLATRPPQGMSILVTSRPAEVSPGSPLRRLSSHLPAGVTRARVALQPLEVADTLCLVSSMLGDEQVSEKFAMFLQERTGGLPLAVEESVRLLCDSRQLIHHTGQWERRSLADLEVPPTVRDSVLDRVQRLTPDAQQVLHAAAVLADPASEAVLAGVARVSPSRMPGLAEALDSGLLQETSPGVVGWRHVLACQATYEAIPVPARRRLHLRAARALQARAPVLLAALARHFGEAGEMREWCRYTERAADLALASGDDKTAAALLHDLLTHAALPAVNASTFPAGPGYGWDDEESLDADMISAVCPDCRIILVEANSNSNSDLFTAEDEAVTLGAKFVSNSWSGCESSGETADDQYFDHPGVAITASGGDNGYDNYLQGCTVPNYPAASPYVTSVGGTTLTRDSSVPRGWTESTWSPDPYATGSGCSQYEPKPPWQTDSGCANRMTNDVSADADPNTGVAIYDSYSGGGWGVYGGTSASSPIIAATYALAGTPAAGTYPAAYPYLNPVGGLNDVTSGTNYDESCTPAYFCTDGPGYDGPTGLGTPDGASAFTPVTSGTFGTLTGTVTDAATGQPVTGGTVSAGGHTATVSSSGGYTLLLAPGSYSLTVSSYGHITKTVTGVQVSGGQATTQNVALSASPGMVTLSGRVTDGSGHGWPLYATVSVPGTPLQPVYTSPYTGEYSISVPADGSYALQATAQYPGYTTATTTAKVGKSGATSNIKVPVDATACIAPGYTAKYAGGGTQFTGWPKAKAKGGWTVTSGPGGNGHTWEFGNDPTGEEQVYNGNPAPPGSDGQYAIADSNRYKTGTLDSTLTSPVVNLSGVTNPQITFDTYYYGYRGQTGEVDLSLDGGQSWTSVWQETTSTVQGAVSIPVPQAAGQADVQVRFHYTGANAWWWSLDNISIGTQACAPQPGGLVDGTVTAASDGKALNGAIITVTGAPHATATSAAAADPALGGFYWLFSPAGTRTLNAAHPGYGPLTQAMAVPRDHVTHQDWALQAGHLTMTPATASVTMPMGAAKTVKVTLGNTGTVPVQVSLGAQDGGFTSAGGAQDSGPPLPARTSTKRALTAATTWTKIASYPGPSGDNAVAYDPLTGDVYSVGFEFGENTMSSGYVYQPGTGKWTPIAPLSAALDSAYAEFIDGTLYLAGGFTGQQEASSAVYAYTPGSNTWSRVASMPKRLFGGAAAVLDGYMYVIGGCDPAAGGYFDCTAGSQAAYRYDPQTAAWAKIANYPVPVQEEACAGIDGQVVCTGGESLAASGTTGMTATYLYDPASNTWRQGADLPFPDYGMAYAGAAGDLQVAGGLKSGTPTVAAPAAQYDPATNTWSTLPKPLYNVLEGGSSCGLYQIGGYSLSPSALQTTYHAEVLPGYDQCDGSGALGWLSENEGSLTINPGQSVTVRVRMDSAAVTQPGTYRATLYAATNTPYPPPLDNLTMNVKPAQGMREVSGTVTTGGHPLAAATAAITAAGQATAAVQTNGLGRYQWWLSGGTGAVQVSAAKDGYQPQAATAAPAAGAPAVTNFTLKPDPSQLPYTSTADATRVQARHGRTLAATTTVHQGVAAHASGARSSHAGPAVRGLTSAQVLRSSPPLSGHAKAICPAAARGHAACLALERTNVTPHKGRFGSDRAPPGYGPPELQSAYNLPSATAGHGETVAIVDAGDNPYAEADLATYRAQYGLPPCTTANGCFEKVNQEGQQGNYPPDLGWDVEESLDIDMVSAICPNCRILLVEANSTTDSDLGASVNEAVALGAKFVSNSYGSTSGEFPTETSYDQYYNHPGVAVTAAAGDSGYGVTYPAASQYVTSVGGTTLTRDARTSRGWKETVWGSASSGSGTGSGCSAYEAKPAWQADTGCSMRTDNDVAADANPATGVAVYDSLDGGWNVIGGTSVASPVIAATYALAGTPGSGDYPASYPYQDPSALNDVTSGADGACTPAYLCTGGPGYDGPTGLGTPDGTAAFTPPAGRGRPVGHGDRRREAGCGCHRYRRRDAGDHEQYRPVHGHSPTRHVHCGGCRVRLCHAHRQQHSGHRRADHHAEFQPDPGEDRHRVRHGD